jgi:hypothetical protein
VVAVLVFAISLAPWWTARLTRKMQPLVVLLPALLVWLLGFEIADPYLERLFVFEIGPYLIETARWLGWLPLAAGFLWLREQRPRRAVRN